MEAARVALEAWYSRRVPEASIVDGERAAYDEVMRDVDSALVKCNGGVKTARAAIATGLIVTNNTAFFS